MLELAGSGDDGSTGLLGGGPARKDDPRTEAYGTTDEASGAGGLWNALALHPRGTPRRWNPAGPADSPAASVNLETGALGVVWGLCRGGPAGVVRPPAVSAVPPGVRPKQAVIPGRFHVHAVRVPGGLRRGRAHHRRRRELRRLAFPAAGLPADRHRLRSAQGAAPGLAGNLAPALAHAVQRYPLAVPLHAS